MRAYYGRSRMGRPAIRREPLLGAVLAAAMLAFWPAAGEGAAATQPDAPQVSVHDPGPQYSTSSSKGHEGHKWERRTVGLDSGTIRYTFLYSACVDPSHGEERASDEGNLGMPEPSSSNWYHGGFLFITINGKEAGGYRLSDMRVTETGARGGFQMVWEHPDATVGLRLLLPARSNHALADLTWRPRPNAEIKSVALRLVNYPSYFTSWNKRKGDRHCATPRADEREPKTLTLVPDKDTWLYYYDTIFDVARGEGEGPCAMTFTPEAVQSGRVSIGDYAVMTDLALKPDAREIRLAFWDFHGVKNADAEAYLKAHGADDLTELARTDFRPEPVRALNFERTKAEVTKLLADAGDEGKPYHAEVSQLLARLADLRGKADAGDWKAEADLATAVMDSSALVWKLRIAALLNSP